MRNDSLHTSHMLGPASEIGSLKGNPSSNPSSSYWTIRQWILLGSFREKRNRELLGVIPDITVGETAYCKVRKEDWGGHKRRCVGGNGSFRRRSWQTSLPSPCLIFSYRDLLGHSPVGAATVMTGRGRDTRARFSPTQDTGPAILAPRRTLLRWRFLLPFASQLRFILCQSCPPTFLSQVWTQRHRNLS